MDPITAIAAAIAAGAATEVGKKVVNGVADGLTEVAKKTIGDAYAGFKDLLKRKFGANSEVVKAVDNVEAEPDSTGYKTVLKEKLTGAGADNDQEIVKAAQDLLALIETHPGGKDTVTQIVQGIGNIAIHGYSNTVTGSNTSFNRLKE